MVKDEKFDTRPSILKPLFKTNDNFMVLEKLYVLTCIRRTNPDPKTRYIIIYECKNESDFLNNNSNSFFKDYFNFPIHKVLYDKGVFLISGSNNKNCKKNPIEFKEWIQRETHCICDTGFGITTQEGLSGYFRRFLGNHFSITDIDFLIIKDNKYVFFIEEKIYVQNESGYIPYGQYLSFQEIQRDIIQKKNKVNFLIVFINNSLELYLYDVNKNGLAYRSPEIIEKWGNMMPIKIKDMEKLEICSFLDRINNWKE